ncbi:hypothetical protein MY11210_002523 [Beauveria gryllotalpidicola]
MDSHLKSLSMRFWSRRETILRPVLWSPEDLRLFGCHFRDVNTSQLQSHVANPVSESSAATDHDVLAEKKASVLQRSSSPLIKQRAIETILADGRLYRRCGTSPLRIRKRIIQKAPYILFRPVEQQHLCSDLPLTGYIDYHCIKRARREGNIRRQRPGHPGYEHYKSPAQITPKEWSADPYVLCILLSIAQHQYYYHKQARRNTTYRACLLVTNTQYPRDIYLFEANIATTLLDQLDDPRIVPNQATPVIINRSRLSIEPCGDFWARIVAALSVQAAR